MSTAMISSEDGYWNAILARDRSADGIVFYGVKTTGVFCRPSCPSRRPSRRFVEFFLDISSALRAGYRACRRCRPDEPALQDELIQKICKLMAGLPWEESSLEEIARQAEVSPFHLQRRFKQALGLTPAEFQRARRFEEFRKQVAIGRGVTDALYTAGFGSSRALYETATNRLGMAPRQYARAGTGTEIFYCVFATRLGTALLAATKIGVCSLRFGDSPNALEAELYREFRNATLRCSDTVIAPYREKVLRFLEGPICDLQLPLDVKATIFQHRVWTAIRDIPIGETRSYKQLAAKIGSPSAARAVAAACRSNPVALAIPCHRVVRGEGNLAGYRWGMERKQQLLTHERSARRPVPGEA